MQMKLCSIAAALLLAFAGTAQAQTSPGGAARTQGPGGAAPTKMDNAEKERIEAAYKADKAQCEAMKDNAKDVCEKEAKGKEKVAKAELAARTNPSERNTRKVEEAKAEAEYDVAKEKCDDMKGNEKDACEKQAKTQRDQARADIKKQYAQRSSEKRSSSAGATSK